MLTVVTPQHKDIHKLWPILRSTGQPFDLIQLKPGQLTEAHDLPFDRLILLGGADVSPFWYGESKHKKTRPAAQDRELLEWSLIRRALNEQIPTLGICRGMQLMTVAAGGSLWQDIRSQNRSPNDHTAGQHRLIKVKSPLDYQIPSTVVNSRHHQAVRVAPYGWRVLARSQDDDIIESIYRPGFLEVQWHPEDLFPHEPGWAGLFRWWLNGLSD